MILGMVRKWQDEGFGTMRKWQDEGFVYEGILARDRYGEEMIYL